MKIITAYENDDEICEITDALSLQGVQILVCPFKEIKREVSSFKADAVFSVGFSEETARLCKERNIPYFSWILRSPEPGLFVPGILYDTNRIYIADRSLYDILKSSGADTVFYKTAGFSDAFAIRSIRDLHEEEFDENDARQRVGFLLDEDENRFLQGLERAQELCHDRNVFFHVLSGGIIHKLYLGLKGGKASDPLSERYFVSECILRRIVKTREKKKLGAMIKKGEAVFCFDDTGIKTCTAMLSGKTVYSDGCGLYGFNRGGDYIFFEDRADLARKLSEKYSCISPSEKLSGYIPKNVVREMIFC